MYNSVVWSLFTRLQNYPHDLIPEHFHYHPKKPHTSQQSFLIASIPTQWKWVGITNLLLSLWICLFWTFFINVFIQYVAFCVCFISLRIIYLEVKKKIMKGEDRRTQTGKKCQWYGRLEKATKQSDLISPLWQ